MSDKYSAIQIAISELDSLANQLKSNELYFDKALTHASNYLKDDQDIQDIRDQKAGRASDSVAEAKDAIRNKLSEINKLIDEKYPS